MKGAPSWMSASGLCLPVGGYTKARCRLWLSSPSRPAGILLSERGFKSEPDDQMMIPPPSLIFVLNIKC